ncbi:MAG TPA: hypothetical protein VMX58_13260 [Patescibacteria group bacterium]|nr:hypothetical protein [Patescibacteria group bacterium]
MVTIGLLGYDYDDCVNRLKVRIEDRGHNARVINLQHLPRVTRATIDLERIVYDGYDLLGMDCFFLKEMDVRDPFFHVRYSEELWGMLRERYLSFAEEEIDNLVFIRNLLWILADRVPVINHPRVYDHRNQMPFHLAALAREGFAVPPFVAGPAGSGTLIGSAGGSGPEARRDDGIDGEQENAGKFMGPVDEVPLRLDECRTWEVFTFPKGEEREVWLERGGRNAAAYRVMIVGDRALDNAVFLPPGEEQGHVVRRAELPAGIEETARRAARALGAKFAEVELECGSDGETVIVRQVDPSPEFSMLEDTYRLSISEPLAEYLVSAGSQRA